MKRLLLIFILLSVKFYAQTNSELGWLPKITVSLPVNNSIKWVNSVEVREVVYDETIKFSHSLLDITSIISVKTNLQQSLNFGYVHRFEKGESIHRFLQQYNFVTNINTLKVAHRLGFEQHIPAKENSFFRLRYRFALQKALNGERTDVNEMYFKLGNEYVYNFNKESIELRLSPYLGYKLSPKDKLELGIEYRGGNIIDVYDKHRWWIRTSWYISI